MKNLLISLSFLCAIVFSTISCEKDNTLKSNNSELIQSTNVDATPIAMPVNGFGTLNYVARWTAPHTLGTGILYDNDTNVGIGTTNPSELLEINGAYGPAKLKISAAGGEDAAVDLYSNSVPKMSIFYEASGDRAFIKTNTTDGNKIPLYFQTGNMNRMVIDGSTGNIGIGLTNPTHRLDVDGEIGATGFVQTSDRNLKKNIQTLDNSLEKILSLRGVSFNWRSDDAPSVGLIAQEVELIYPELVSSKNGKYGVQYANLVGPLIEAVKSQQALINCQQEQINSLQEQNKIFNERLKKLEQQPVAKR